jgi:hypothetical protein
MRYFETADHAIEAHHHALRRGAKYRKMSQLVIVYRPEFEFVCA